LRVADPAEVGEEVGEVFGFGDGVAAERQEGVAEAEGPGGRGRK
jgi:hypothetical protein